MNASKAQKFGCPLYAVAWASPELVLLAGGGGKKTSGIKNKVLAASCKDGRLGEECAAYLTGDSEFDVPYRLILHPEGKTGLVSMAGVGGCRLINVLSEAGGDKVTIEVDKERSEAAKLLSTDVGVSRLAFAGDEGSQVVLGLENGHVVTCSYPSMKQQAKFDIWTKEEREKVKKDDIGIKDMDLAPKSVGPMLATVSETGVCSIWHWPQGEKIHALSVPLKLKSGRGYNCCRFARDTDDMFGEPNTIYATINAGGAGYLLAWNWGGGTAVNLYEALQKGFSKAKLATCKRVTPEPITCMEISPSGRWIAAGTSEGDLVICHAGTRAKVRQVKQAHLVFTTGLAWATDSKQLVSISGDASAYLLQAPPPPGLLASPFVQLILACLVLLMAVLVPKLLRYDVPGVA